MSKPTKETKRKFVRALQYLQAAVAHVDLKYLKAQKTRYNMETAEPITDDEIVTVVGYPVGTLHGYGISDATVWVGVQQRNVPGDNYRYHAWGLSGAHQIVAGWPGALVDGVDDQQKFSQILKKALNGNG